MAIPNKPSVVNPDLALKTTWGGTKTTYTNDEITNGHGAGTPLGRQIKSTLLNHDKQYDIEWIKHNSDAIDYIGQNTELYTDSGTANAIVLSINSGEAITSYYDGLKVRFYKNLNNTSATTIDVDGIGVKDVVDSIGNALTSGTLVNGRYYELIYNASNDEFRLIDTKANQIDIPTANTADMPTLANNATDADHDIDFTTGWCYDLTTKVRIELTSAITKRFDATFAEGTGNGGFATGESLPTSGTIHIWLISKADGTTDVFANNHSINGLNPTLPTGFVNKRRIGSLRTNASANIIGVIQFGNKFCYKTPVIDINGTATTSKTTYSLSIPSGFICRLFGGVYFSVDTGSYNPVVYIETPNLTNPVVLGCYSSNTLEFINDYFEQITNNSGQLVVYADGAGINLQLKTLGYEDLRLN